MREETGKKRKIGRLIFLIMAISSALILVTAYLFLSNYIRTKAEEAIQKSVDQTAEPGWEYEFRDSTDNDSLFEVVSIVSSSTYAEREWDWNWEYYTGETELIAWCREHSETSGKIVKASVGGNVYYVEQIPLEYNDMPKEYWEYSYDAGEGDTAYSSGRDDIRIFSVNVTSSIWMISMTEILLAVIMAACTAVATWLGYRTDRAIGQEQEKQKRFFENASHELKTPLMAIRGFAEGLQKGILPDEEHALDVITEEANKMAGLVDDILALSKADRRLDELRKEEISVSELVGDCLDTLEAEIRKRDLRVEIHIEDRFITVDVDKMKQAVTNILANGIRYAEKEIRITFSRDTLQILDDGRPLSEEEQQHMFERFHTGEGGSTGIGMALAKEFARMHGFTLSVENTPQGVCFSLQL